MQDMVVGFTRYRVVHYITSGWPNNRN